MIFDLHRFESAPVIGILRGVKEESLQGVLETSIAGGLRFIEITLNTQDSYHLIQQAINKYSELTIGAGTVLSALEAKKAFDSGAQFIVAPNFEEEVAAFCVENKLAYFPGALTPTEIQKAWKCGATMVKLFPVSQMGPDYIKQVKGPFDKVKLVAVGGVNPSNIKKYLSAGVDALALGGSIYSLQRMENGKFSDIQKDIEDFMFEVKTFYSNISKTP
jgi:2-dehydro-3-deoxyphosphogluconate aldolase / (4S)-4-hydroxy-2-oxoglutarate aldolase